MTVGSYDDQIGVMLGRFGQDDFGYGSPCVYRKLKPARSDGEARRGPDVNESFRPDESDGKSAHPCAETDVF
jgi:hypothetical protein